MEKKNIIKIAVAIVVLATIGGGYYYFKASSAAKAKNAVKYTTVNAKKGTIAVTIQATGAASAAISDNIVSSNNGTISSVNVKVGDTVKKGQTIGYINDTAQQQSVNLAKLKVQQDNTNSANSKATLQQSVNSAQLKVTQDKTNISNNKDAQKVESYNTALAQDQADLSSKTTQLTQYFASSSSNNIQLLQDTEDLNSKTAQLAKETVMSPISGVIVTLNFNNEDTVQSGKTIATVVDMNSLQIEAQVDELDIAKVTNGQKATITFDALTGKTYTGTISKVSQLGTTTSDVTSYPVYISIDNPTGIKIGMNGNINITVASKSNVLTLDLDAVQTINGKKYVMTSIPTKTSGNSTASKTNSASTSTMSTNNMKEVTTGLINSTNVEISSGLQEGNTVYIKQATVSTSTTSATSTSKTSANTGTSNFGGGSMPSGGGGGGN